MIYAVVERAPACGLMGAQRRRPLSNAKLVLAELVANAVRHAGAGFDLWVRLTSRYLALAVFDGGSVPPTPGTPITHSAAEQVAAGECG
ncbi:hypothetical protein AB0M36_35880 [Actinoplanes sp. NPDC051346]|uniref:hypothetical protein n=1 Tax=Actinoplanes sp. NPDC051346 TaxID=3155048 RepID=UPI00342E5708